MLPVVIYNGGRRWTPPTDVADLIAPVRMALLGHRPRHPYLLVENQAEDPASEIRAGTHRRKRWLPELKGLFMARLTDVVTLRHGEPGRTCNARAPGTPDA